MFTVVTKKMTYVHKDNLLVSLLLQIKILGSSLLFTKKITCYVHCCFKENYMLCSLLLQRVFDMFAVLQREFVILCIVLTVKYVFFTVVTKKIICNVHCYYKNICYVHCYNKENYLLCTLFLQIILLVIFIFITKKLTCFLSVITKKFTAWCSMLHSR